MIVEFLEITFSRHDACKLLCDTSPALARSSPTRRYTGTQCRRIDGPPAYVPRKCASNTLRPYCIVKLFTIRLTLRSGNAHYLPHLFREDSKFALLLWVPNYQTETAVQIFLYLYRMAPSSRVRACSVTVGQVHCCRQRTGLTIHHRTVLPPPPQPTAAAAAARRPPAPGQFQRWSRDASRAEPTAIISSAAHLFERVERNVDWARSTAKTSCFSAARRLNLRAGGELVSQQILRRPGRVEDRRRGVTPHSASVVREGGMQLLAGDLWDGTVAFRIYDL